jgi:dTDP-4-dehydrorhamnose reductase
MKVAILGAAGQVGRALDRDVPVGVEVIALDRQDVDITDSEDIARLLREREPDVVVDCAAYTAVDNAENDAVAAAQVNAVAPGVLARCMAGRQRCRLVHISTDYVFDGARSTPYAPEDSPAPVNVYGRTKLDGELAIQRSDAHAVVLRTAWVYAPRGRNFLTTMLRIMREKGVVRVVADQRGTPTSAYSVARAIWRIVEAPMLRGTLHWTDSGVVSWYEFAVAIGEEAFRANLLPRTPEVLPIPTSAYPTPARRPAFSVLDTATSAATLGMAPRAWRSSLQEVIGEIARV